MGSWQVIVTPEAQDDLRRLSKRRRKVWQEAKRLTQGLEQDPFVGESCDPPLVDVRRMHFWNDKYRLAWRIVEDDARVDVLAIDLKSPRFYERVLERLLGLTDLIG